MSDPILYGPDKHHSCGPLPLIVGFTGQEPPGLSTKLVRCFRQLRKRYPSTPLVLLTSLSHLPGRVAAEAALELGYRLLVVRPGPRDDQTPLPEEAAKLLGKAEYCPPVPTSQNQDEFIRDHCQILIAQEKDTLRVTFPSRSASSRKSTRRGAHSGLGALCWLVVGFVWGWICAGAEWLRNRYRALAEWLDNPEFGGEGLPSGPRAFDHVDAFNRNVVCSVRVTPHYDNAEGLLPSHELRQLPGATQATAGALRSWFADADTLALHFQAKANWWRGLLVVLLTLTLFVWGLILTPPHDGRIPYLGTAALFFSPVTAVFTWWMWRRRLLHIAARALAEGLRVQFFWRLVGIPHEETPSDSLNWKHIDLEVVPLGLRNWHFLAARGDPLPPSNLPGRRLAMDYWVKPQVQYFTRKRSHARKALSILIGVALVLLVVGGGWRVFRYFWDYPPLFPSLFKGTLPFGIGYCLDMVLLQGLIALGLALITNIPFGKWPDLQKTAEEMTRIYTDFAGLADKRGQAIHGLAGAGMKKLLAEDTEAWRQLGKEALLESGEWIEGEQPRM